MAFRVVTDSSCDLPDAIVDELDLTVVPCTVHFGEAVYRDGVDLSRRELYERLRKDSVNPTTSQPTVGVFVETYERLGKEAEEVLSLHLSSKLSATSHSASLAKDELKDGPCIEVVDSLQVSLGLGILVREAGRMARDGSALDDALAFLRSEIPNVTSYCTVDTLDYLVRGGRASRLHGLFGSLLDIKPIIMVRDNGETHAVGRARTKKRAVGRFVEIVAAQKGLRALGILHGAAPEEAEALALACASYFPRDQIILSEFSAVMGAHLGPGALGMSFWAQP